MRIYLDTCALNRLTDSPSQPRVRIESEAVEQILKMVSKGRLYWVASAANELEIRRNPDEQLRLDGLKLLSFAGEFLQPASAARQRGREFERAGYGTLDALHLACAEQGKVKVLLTTDDRFINRAARMLGNPSVRVINPVDWLREAGR